LLEKAYSNYTEDTYLNQGQDACFYYRSYTDKKGRIAVEENYTEKRQDACTRGRISEKMKMAGCLQERQDTRKKSRSPGGEAISEITPRCL
jgi:hypothetical protein